MKRLLAFLALLALGIVALRIAIGDETAVRGGASTRSSAGQGPDAPVPDSGTGVAFEHGKVSATVTVRGQVDWPRKKATREADGSVRWETIYVLKAADSRPLAAGVQQFDAVELLLNDHGVHVATMRAERAFAELSRDANGRPSLDENKDIDLRKLVLDGLPSGRLAGLHGEFGDAKVRIEGDEVRINTARDQDVLVTMAGERPMTLRGKGMQARLPRDSNGALQRADLEILSRPELTGEGFVARADGRLHWYEDLAAGAGRITLDDRIEVELADGVFALPSQNRTGATRGRTTVRGDQFLAWLVRREVPGANGGKRSEVQWRKLVLTGAPASVDLPEGRLTTPRLTALPGPFGEPFLVTAHGGESKLEQLQLRPGSRQKDPVTGTAQRRIHVVRPGQQSGAMHRAFGFPQWTLRIVDGLQVVSTEGRTQLDSGARSLMSRDGVHLLRRDGADTGFVRGFGPVELRQKAKTAGEPDLVATGSDGFTIRATPAGEELHLGPPLDSGTTVQQLGAHTFDIRRGDAWLRGQGSAKAVQTGERIDLTVVAAEASLLATLPSEGIDLRGLHRLAATWNGTTLTDFDAAGWPANVHIARGDEKVLARAPRVRQIGPRSMRLLPADPATPMLWSGLPDADRLPVIDRAGRSAHSSESIQVRGHQVDVHQVGARDVLVDAAAVDDERPTIHATITGPDGVATTTIAATAERLRLLPGLLPRDVLRWHGVGDHSALATVAGHSLAQPWLVVDRVHAFELDDPRHGHVTGRGHRLFVSRGGGAAIFVGDPESGATARVERTKDGRVVTLDGARVRLFDDELVRLQALATFADGGTPLLPKLVLREGHDKGLLSHMQAVCGGDIEVLPREVLFRGPVRADALSADGTVDAAGLHLDAAELHMLRDSNPQRSTYGEVVAVTGKEVVVAWTRMSARCGTIAFDLPRNRCTIADDDEATVVLENGLEVRAPRVEVDYDTLALRGQGLRVRQLPAEVAR
ncbi:MAG: hypothetical protein JNK15_25005 [Planctomycetes bacterium]|nr:hypothetical protein [Planctomycetota bacterium]